MRVDLADSGGQSGERGVGTLTLGYCSTSSALTALSFASEREISITLCRAHGGGGVTRYTQGGAERAEGAPAALARQLEAHRLADAVSGARHHGPLAVLLGQLGPAREERLVEHVEQRERVVSQHRGAEVGRGHPEHIGHHRSVRSAGRLTSLIGGQTSGRPRSRRRDARVTPRERARRSLPVRSSENGATGRCRSL